MKNKDEGTNKAIMQGVYTATTVATGVSIAAINGAGSLAGYAGMSSAVSRRVFNIFRHTVNFFFVPFEPA